MIITDIVKELNLEVISGREGLSNEITGGYCSDLLSDVMGNAQEGQVWITLQTHKNVMAIASLKDLAAVIIVQDFEVAKDTIEVSNEENIPILRTSMKTFDITARLYNLLTV